MHNVTKLVKECFDFAVREERRVCRGRFCKIGDHRCKRRNIIIPQEFRAASSDNAKRRSVAVLSFAWIEVEGETGEDFTFGCFNCVEFCVRVPEREPFELFKRHTKEGAVDFERTLKDTRDREVRTHLFAVKVEAALL